MNFKNCQKCPKFVGILQIPEFPDFPEIYPPEIRGVIEINGEFDPIFWWKKRCIFGPKFWHFRTKMCKICTFCKIPTRAKITNFHVTHSNPEGIRRIFGGLLQDRKCTNLGPKCAKFAHFCTFFWHFLTFFDHFWPPFCLEFSWWNFARFRGLLRFYPEFTGEKWG